MIDNLEEAKRLEDEAVAAEFDRDDTDAADRLRARAQGLRDLVYEYGERYDPGF